MCGVVVIALTAEGIAAALRTAVRTNRRSAVSTFSYGSLATWHTYVAITVYELDLAEWTHGKSTEYNVHLNNEVCDPEELARSSPPVLP